MTSQKDFLRKIIAALDSAGIPYMLSGSMGSSFHGRPRATNDVDIVIAATEAQLQGFTNSLGKDYYVSPDAAKEALKRRSAFNIIDIRMGWKADLIIRKARPFSREEFGRRQTVNLMGLDMCILTPEDAILSKLEWSKGVLTGSQFEDALGVAIVQWGRLDRDYLHKWAEQLRVEELLDELLARVKKRIDSR